MDSGHPCRACGRGLAEAFGAKLPTQREQEEQAREQAEWLMNPAEAAQARDASARAASRRKLWEAQGREERAQKAAHIQDTVARAEAEA